jgi:hypothetical protein
LESSLKEACPFLDKQNLDTNISELDSTLNPEFKEQYDMIRVMQAKFLTFRLYFHSTFMDHISNEKYCRLFKISQKSLEDRKIDSLVKETNFHDELEKSKNQLVEKKSKKQMKKEKVSTHSHKLFNHKIRSCRCSLLTLIRRKSLLENYGSI